MYRYIIECRDNSKITIYSTIWFTGEELVGENVINLENSKIYLYSTIKNVIHLP
jgi:hypothetical protein